MYFWDASFVIMMMMSLANIFMGVCMESVTAISMKHFMLMAVSDLRYGGGEVLGVPGYVNARQGQI